MEFFHSTLVPDKNIVHIAVIESKPPYAADVLIIYPKSLLIATITAKPPKITFDPLQLFYIETPLVWSTVIGELLISFSITNQILISHYPSLQRFSVIDLDSHRSLKCDPQSYSSFCVSPNHRYLSFLAKNSLFYIVDLKDPSEPILFSIPIDYNTIHALVPLPDSSTVSFAILVSNPKDAQTKEYPYSQKKILILTNLRQNGQFDSIIPQETPPDAISLIPSNEKSINFICLCENSFILFQPSSPSKAIKLPAQPLCFTSLDNGFTLIQMNNNSLFYYPISGGNPQVIYNHNNCSNIYQICPKVFCNSSGRITLIKPISNRKRINFESLKSLSYFPNCINDPHASLFDPNEKTFYIASDSGFLNISQAGDFNGTQSVIYSGKCGDNDLENGKIYALSKKTLISVNSNETKVISGSIKSSPNHGTIAVTWFNDKRIQVTKKGIYVIGTNDFVQYPDISLAASDGDKLVICHSKHKLTLFSGNLLTPEETYLDFQESKYITAIGISNDFIGLSLYDSETFASQVLLLDTTNLVQVSREFLLPSPVTSLVFNGNLSSLPSSEANSFALYVGCLNKSVLRLSIDENGFTNDCSYIYFKQGSADIQLISRRKTNYFIIFDGFVHFFMDDVLIDSGMEEVDQISFLESEDPQESPFAFVQKNFHIYTATFRYPQKKFIIGNTSSTKNAVSLSLLDKDLICLYNIPLSNEIYDETDSQVSQTETGNEIETEYSKEGFILERFGDPDDPPKFVEDRKGKAVAISVFSITVQDSANYTEEETEKEVKEEIPTSKKTKKKLEKKKEKAEEEVEESDNESDPQKGGIVAVATKKAISLYFSSPDRFQFLTDMDITDFQGCDPSINESISKTEIISMATSEKYLYIGLNNSLRIAKLGLNSSYLLNQIKSYKVPLIPQAAIFQTNAPVQCISIHRNYSKDFVWIGSNKTAACLFYDSPEDRFKIISLGKLSGNPVSVIALDDLSAAFGLDDGTVVIEKIRPEIAHGTIVTSSSKIPSLESVVSIYLGKPIISLQRSQFAIFYVTSSGAVGSLIPVSSIGSFITLKEYQHMILEKYHKRAGFFIPNEDALARQNEVLDLDIFDYAKNLLRPEDYQDFNFDVVQADLDISQLKSKLIA